MVEISSRVSACSRPVSSTNTSMGRPARAMASVSTMSSADRLLAAAAGANCAAMSESSAWSVRSGTLVGNRERLEGSERFRRILALAQLEGVEADALHVVEVVARDLADGAQLAPVAVAGAQQLRDRVAATVAELGEAHLDPRRAREGVRHRSRVVARLEANHPRLRRGRALANDSPLFDQRCHRRFP